MDSTQQRNQVNPRDVLDFHVEGHPIIPFWDVETILGRGKTILGRGNHFGTWHPEPFQQGNQVNPHDVLDFLVDLGTWTQINKEIK
jgi:hypothetical protein